MNGNISKELRMMGHTITTQKNSARLGFSDSSESKDPEDEVNDYLMRAIDARSIDRLRSEHCKSVSLSFKQPSIEQKVCDNIKISVHPFFELFFNLNLFAQFFFAPM